MTMEITIDIKSNRVNNNKDLIIMNDRELQDNKIRTMGTKNKIIMVHRNTMIKVMIQELQEVMYNLNLELIIHIRIKLSS